MIGRVVARALAGGDDLEAAGARPVDVLADERRLIAPGQRVDDARRARLLRQQRPGDASASTLTITMCLPCSMAARQSLMPVAGSPVASMITSMSGQVISAIASSVTNVLPVLSASPSDLACVCSAGQPTSIMRLAGALRHQVGEADQVHARRQAHLCERTWCRTCRRRSGRCGPACPAPRAPSACMKGSSRFPLCCCWPDSSTARERRKGEVAVADSAREM